MAEFKHLHALIQDGKLPQLSELTCVGDKATVCRFKLRWVGVARGACGGRCWCTNAKLGLLLQLCARRSGEACLCVTRAVPSALHHPATGLLISLLSAHGI